MTIKELAGTFKNAILKDYNMGFEYDVECWENDTTKFEVMDVTISRLGNEIIWIWG